MNYIPNTKRHIIELLQLLASEQKQLDYEKSVPIADVPAELLCMWFDDLYYPGSIEAQFDSSEAATLARFNAFYGVERKKLPPGFGTIRTWLANPTWRKIMAAADEALKEICGKRDSD